jgi:hypothetical protein
VLVTESELQPPNDVEDRGVTYRHVVIPTKPESVSQTARSRPQQTRRPSRKQ